MDDQRRAEDMYEAPKVTDYGELADLTGGSHDGDYTDADFPINTPKRNLTFSSVS
jgi:hypothetical protein